MMMRGCKCAISTKTAPKFLPNFSSAAVLCRAVRAGQLSTRKKMITVVIATIRATTVNAIGHETRCDFTGFDIGCLTLSVERFFSSGNRARACLRASAKRNRQTFVCKKLLHPTPDRREGRLFPPEQL